MSDGTGRAAAFRPCPLFLALVLLTLGAAEIDSFLHGHVPPHKTASLSTVFLSLAIFGIPFAIAARPRSVRGWIDVLAACLILPMGNAIMPWATARTIRVLPDVFDAQVYALDATLGFQPSFAVGDLFARYPAFAATSGAMYGAVLFPAALVAAIEAMHGRRRGLGALPMFLLIAGVGFPLYHWLPVIGPAAWFGPSFPFENTFSHPPSPRTTMPSLHTAWVVMAFLCSRGMSLPIRTTAGVLATGTIVATLGSGAHYLLDLVVACPFVLLVRGLGAIELPVLARQRVEACLMGAALVGAWGLAVRGAVHPTALIPAAMVVTVVMSGRWESRLAQAEAAI